MKWCGAIPGSYVLGDRWRGTVLAVSAVRRAVSATPQHAAPASAPCRPRDRSGAHRAVSATPQHAAPAPGLASETLPTRSPSSIRGLPVTSSRRCRALPGGTRDRMRSCRRRRSRAAHERDLRPDPRAGDQCRYPRRGGRGDQLIVHAFVAVARSLMPRSAMRPAIDETVGLRDAR